MKMKQFTEIPSLRSAIIVILASLVASQLVTSASARYLPTRSQDDRLDKLRELLKDLLENDYERRATMIDYGDTLVAPGHAGSGIYKRSATLTSPDKGLDSSAALKAMDRYDSSSGRTSPILIGAQNLRRSMK